MPPDETELESAADLTSQGVRLARQSRFEESAECFRRALACNPAYHPAQRNLAIVLESLGDLRGAIQACQLLLPHSPDPKEIHNKLGNLFAKRGEFEGALNHFRRALALGCNLASAHGNIGSALGSLKRHGEAIDEFRRAIELDPECATFYIGLGMALASADEGGQAEVCLRKALALEPNNAQARLNLALSLKNAGRIAEAISQYQLLLDSKSWNTEARRGLAICYFLQGNFERGFEEYESRIALGDVRITHPAAMWNDENLVGKTLLIETEQGMGDTLQFVRYLAAVKIQHACRLVLACEPQLVALLSGIGGADEVIRQNSARPDFDFWLPLLSLPRLLGRRMNLFATDTPYLKADASRTLRWKDRLSSIPGLKVGIAWQGNPEQQNDALRSVPLREFEPLAILPSVNLVSLQKGFGSEQIESCPRVPLVALGNDFDSGPDAFVDTAAVMKNLDLVISVDTAVAHLAGALGVPVWLVLPFAPDWRWTSHGEQTPWYPSMRIFRQQSPGDWESVFERVARELAANP